MSDSSIEASIEVKTDNKSISIEPQDLVQLLETNIRINSITAGLKITRSIPRDKFEKNEYFTSVNTEVSSVYEILDNQKLDAQVKKTALSKAVVNRCNTAFNLCRALLSKQQQADGIALVSFAEKTEIK